jgi:hypothetical protein
MICHIEGVAKAPFFTLARRPMTAKQHRQSMAAKRDGWPLFGGEGVCLTVSDGD